MVIAEVKARRQSLTNGLSSQLSLIKEATEAAYPEAKVQAALILGAGRGRPTRIERALEEEGVRLFRVNPDNPGAAKIDL